MSTINPKIAAVLKTLLKVSVTVLCLWYVSRKIDWTLTWQLLQQSQKWWLMVALVLITFSKVVSAYRLNIYFRNIDIQLIPKHSLQLYWMGMFYNLFLPGGIGGDAYKVILLNKRYKDITAKRIAAAVLLDRISGVVALGILAAMFYWLIYRGAQWSWWPVVGIIPGMALYYWVVKRFFPSFIKGFSPTFFLGLMVQALQVLSVYAIMCSIGINDHFNPFQFLFLLSSIVAILPFTIGGLGAREVVFLWGATQFGLDAHQAVFISLLFYLIHLLISFVGIRWVYKDPMT